MTTLLAQTGWWCPDHMTGWTGALMWIGMGVFWLAIIGLVVWGATRVVASSRSSQSSSAEDVLAQRFARGEIDADEYHERIGTLRR